MYHDFKKVSTCLSQHGNPYRLTGYTERDNKNGAHLN